MNMTRTASRARMRRWKRHRMMETLLLTRKLTWPRPCARCALALRSSALHARPSSLGVGAAPQTHAHNCTQAPYRVLGKADIARSQQEVVESVTSILGISDEEATRVLRRYKWCVI